MDRDEQQLGHAEWLASRATHGELLERIDWRLHYGEFRGLGSIRLALWIIVGLLGLLVWRSW